MTRRRLLAALALALIALAGLLFGAFAADPLGVVFGLQEARLRWAGGRAERFAAADGSRLLVKELGPLSAEVPVVLLHGLGAASPYWVDAALALRKAGRTVLMPDAPGSGKSDPPRSLDGYGLANRVAAVASLVDALGLEKMDLVGHSLGGWTAALYALEAPHHVRRLVLVDAAGLTDPGREEELRESVVPRDREGGRRLLGLLFHRKPFPFPGVVVDSFVRQYGASPAVVETVAHLSRADAVLGREHELPHGTVLIWGEEETLFPVQGARAVAPRIPGARLLVLRGVGHDGPLEAPAEFHQALLSALDGTPLPTVPAR